MDFCPGHAGVCGNERADKLAGSARVEGSFTLDAPTVMSTIRDHPASSNVEASYVVQKGVKYGEGTKRGEELWTSSFDSDPNSANK